jgi:hypothetical protein
MNCYLARMSRHGVGRGCFPELGVPPGQRGAWLGVGHVFGLAARVLGFRKSLARLAGLGSRVAGSSGASERPGRARESGLASRGGREELACELRRFRGRGPAQRAKPAKEESDENTRESNCARGAPGRCARGLAPGSVRLPASRRLSCRPRGAGLRLRPLAPAAAWPREACGPARAGAARGLPAGGRGGATATACGSCLSCPST